MTGTERRKAASRGKALAAAAAALILALLCTGALAETASGMWGTCPWTLENGVLTIGEAGAETEGVDPDTSFPWKEYAPTAVRILGTVKLPANCSGLFQNIRHFESLGSADTSGVRSMSQMFMECFNEEETLGETLDIGGWDTSNVTNMSQMFFGNPYLQELDLSGWDTSKVESMKDMFLGCHRLSHAGLDSWDTSSVTNMSQMFMNCCVFGSEWSLGQEIGGWDTSSVTDMYQMFAAYSEACSYHADIAVWSGENRYGTLAMDLSDWDTSSVTNMYCIFANHNVEGLNVSGWNTSSVWNMGGMFFNCVRVPTDIGAWDVSNVTWLKYMFSGASFYPGSALDLSRWNTGKVTTTESMFSETKGLDSVDLSGWDTSQRVYAAYMFSSSGLRSIDMTGWDTSSMTMDYMFQWAEGITTFKVGEEYVFPDRYLDNCDDCIPNGALWWSERDQTCYTRQYIIEKRDRIADIYTLAVTPTSGDWGTCPWSIDEKGLLTIGTEGEETYGQNTTDSGGLPWFDIGDSIRDVVFLGKVCFPQNVSSLFAGCCGLRSVDFGETDTASVTDMHSMFNGCSALETLNVSNWDTSKVTDMHFMFKGCSKLETLNLVGWNTESVTDREDFFTGMRGIKTLMVGSHFVFDATMGLPDFEGSWFSESAQEYFSAEEIMSGRSETREVYTWAASISLKELSYRFSNEKEAFHGGRGEFDRDLYYVMLDPATAALFSVIRKWNGSCEGFAATTMLFNGPYSGLALDSFGAQSVADLLPDTQSDTYSVKHGKVFVPLTIRELIDAFQVAQIAWQDQREHIDSFGATDSLSAIIEEVEKGEVKHRLPLIGIHGRTNGNILTKTVGTSHALVGYHVKHYNTESRIYVYDPNYSMGTRYITVKKDRSGNYTGWSYRFNNAYDWGTGEPFDEICVTTYSTIKSHWKYRFPSALQTRNGGEESPSDRVFALVSAPIFTIKDASGTVVAGINDEGFYSNAEGIWLCQGTYTDFDGVHYLIRLPAGEYTVSVPEGTAEGFRVGIADRKQYALVETTAGTVTIRTQDADGDNRVAVASAGPEDEFTVTLGAYPSLDVGPEDEETVVITGTGEGAELRIGTDDGEWTLDNCADVSVMVNGETLQDGALLFGERQNLSFIGAQLENADYAWTGAEVTPQIVLPDGTVLREGEDYEATYANNVNATYAGSAATVVVRGINGYCGERTLTFDISYEGEVMRLPENLREIGSRAFADTKAGFVYVPQSVTDIAADAFPAGAILLLSPDSPLIAWAEENDVPYRLQ